jgi:hypothetical protein
MVATPEDHAWHTASGGAAPVKFQILVSVMLMNSRELMGTRCMLLLAGPSILRTDAILPERIMVPGGLLQQMRRVGVPGLRAALDQEHRLRRSLRAVLRVGIVNAIPDGFP